MYKEAKCIGCEAQEIKLLIDFGNQPPSNRYFKNGQVQFWLKQNNAKI